VISMRALRAVEELPDPLVIGNGDRGSRISKGTSEAALRAARFSQTLAIYRASISGLGKVGARWMWVSSENRNIPPPPLRPRRRAYLPCRSSSRISFHHLVLSRVNDSRGDLPRLFATKLARFASLARLTRTEAIERTIGRCSCSRRWNEERFSVGLSLRGIEGLPFDSAESRGRESLDRVSARSMVRDG